MRLKYPILYVLIFIIFISFNVVVAADNDCNSSLSEVNVLEANHDEFISLPNDSNSFEKINSNQNINDWKDGMLSDSEDLKINYDYNPSLNEECLLSASENMNHIYISPNGTGNGLINNATSFTNAINNLQSNTVIHMAEGNYYIGSGISKSNLENITIMADNPQSVKISNVSKITFKNVKNFCLKDMIVGNSSNNFLYFESSNNLQIVNCNFMNFVGDKVYIIETSKSGKISIKNCNFTNNAIKCSLMLLDEYATIPNTYDININNCKFENNTCNYYNIGIRGNDVVEISECKFVNNSDSSQKVASEIFLTNQNKNNIAEQTRIYDCYFSNRVNPAVHSSKTTDGGLYFEDNIVESKYAIYMDLSNNNKITSNTFIKILNNETMNVTVGDKIRIPIQLLDDNGNYIHAYYSKSNKKTDNVLINGTTYKFDYYFFVDDHYYVDYTVPNTLGELSVNATCSYFDMELCTVKGAILNVKPAVDFVWNDINGVYSENVTISLNISNLESGDLTYLIYKGSELVRNISDSFTGNVSSIEVEGLSAGDYTVKVNYADGEIYGPTSSSKTFTVNKANSTIELNMDSIIAAGDKISVEAIVPGVGGIVTFRINNTAYSKTESVSEGVAVAVFDALGAGEYTIIASWDGDDNYNPSEEFNTTFKTVNKDYPVIEITHGDINVGEDVLITVTVPGASGDVIVTIDGVNQTLTLNNSAVNTTISSIRDGRHVVVAEYLGDDNYKPGSETISFTVDKLVSSIDLAIGEAKILEDVPITITIVNATGDVVVTIDGVDETHTLDNGVATTKIPNVSSGNHVVSVNYAGDIKYGSSYATKSFTVDKLTTKLELTNSSVEIDKEVILSIALDESINDNVTVIVNGASESVKLTNGCTDYVIKKVSAGKYNIVVNFDGNDKFDKSSNATSFDVSKLNSNLQASMEKPVISVGDDAVIIISIDSNASGLINVEGKYYEIGDSIVIKGLANGTHTFTVKYGGDEKFNADESDVTVTVNKLAFKPEIEADDVSFGEEAYIWVYGLPEDATGNVTIYVDNLPGIEGTYAGVDDLAKGSHNVRVTYSGDDKYNASEASKSFKVYYTIEIENEDTDFAYGEDAVINVTLPEDAEGILGVLLDGKQTGISAKVSNGSAVFTLSNLTMGDHTLSLTYQGSPEAIETNVSISVVPAASVPENVTTTDSITLNLPENATGNLTVIVDGNKTVIPVVNGSASYSLGNLPAGDHEVTATYNGNYGQWTLMNDEKLSVAKSKPTATINAPASVTAGTVSTLSVSLPSDAKGVVLFDVDGNKYYADVNNGVASVSVSGLSAGDKAVSYRYLGDDKYSAFDGKATLKVSAPQTPAKTVEKPTLTLKKVKVKKSAKKLVIRATLKINGKLASGKKVTFKFNGKTYKATTNKKGVAKITVKKAVLKKLKVGKKVKYQASYGGKTVKKTVKVKK